ncbi:hypothetical protein PFISCL1PPCAC_9462, partial [Pristionchus fissidentatus]
IERMEEEKEFIVLGAEQMKEEHEMLMAERQPQLEQCSYMVHHYKVKTEQQEEKIRELTETLRAIDAHSKGMVEIVEKMEEWQRRNEEAVNVERLRNEKKLADALHLIDTLRIEAGAREDVIDNQREERRRQEERISQLEHHAEITRIYEVDMENYADRLENERKEDEERRIVEKRAHEEALANARNIIASLESKNREEIASLQSEIVETKEEIEVQAGTIRILAEKVSKCILLKSVRETCIAQLRSIVRQEEDGLLAEQQILDIISPIEQEFAGHNHEEA